jgi:hypothetical protein
MTKRTAESFASGSAWRSDAGLYHLGDNGGPSLRGEHAGDDFCDFNILYTTARDIACVRGQSS